MRKHAKFAKILRISGDKVFDVKINEMGGGGDAIYMLTTWSYSGSPVFQCESLNMYCFG